jgi:dephospho-CoA kinase
MPEPSADEDALPDAAVAFTGMPGAGKSLAVETARERDLPVVRMGDAVLAEVEDRGLEPNEDSVGRIASRMREREGPGVWARRTLEGIRDVEGEPVVIDGVRTLDEVRVFREALGDDFTLVAIHAAPGTRMERLLDRGREDDVVDENEFRARDERELGWGVGRVIALADVMLVNEGGPKRFQDRVADVLDDATA